MGPQSAFETFGVEAGYLARLTWIMVGGGIVIALAVAALFFFAIRSREGAIGHRGGMRLVLWAGGLSYPLLIAYGLAAGSISAFAVPTRDALLPTVAGRNLPRAVALATALQFVGQLVGIAAASQASSMVTPTCVNSSTPIR